VPYSAPSAANMACAFMHKTNYAVNKQKIHFIQNNSKKATFLAEQEGSANTAAARTASTSGATSPAMSLPTSNAPSLSSGSTGMDTADPTGAGEENHDEGDETSEESKSHKRSLSWFWKWMKENGKDR
jgi:hypothetical protein